jgi:transcriptional regulator with XRE-family HTH domain
VSDDSGTLADFLRAARARISPADIGIALTVSRGGRRVPGLRRDEVANLAGLSVDYYTRMEQGRVARASDAVINGLATALRLNAAEHNYLFSLLSTSTNAGRQRRRVETVRPTVAALVDSMVDTPAFVVGVGMDVLAMNDLAASLLSDFRSKDGLQRSLARWTFLDPAARLLYVDWEVVAADVAAILRRDSRNHPNDSNLNELIGELTVKSDDFLRWWSHHKVYECAFGTKRLNHPTVGRLDINYETFAIAGNIDQQLFIYRAPVGSPSEDALRILASWNQRPAEIDPEVLRPEVD